MALLLLLMLAWSSGYCCTRSAFVKAAHGCQAAGQEAGSVTDCLMAGSACGSQAYETVWPT